MISSGSWRASSTAFRRALSEGISISVVELAIISSELSSTWGNNSLASSTSSSCSNCSKIGTGFEGFEGREY